MKKRYILNGFASREDAQKRNHEFALKAGIKEDSTTKYMFQQHCLVREQWGLEVTEDYLHLLDSEEKTTDRLIEVKYQPFLQPYIPMVFRYLEKEFVDLFFNEGKLRLSSFKKFHQHTDEQRRDNKEGKNVISGYNNEHRIVAVASTGHNAFVLSSSLLYNKQLYKDFNVDDCFIIERPLEFINAISKQIVNFLGVNFGPCLYQSGKTIHRQIHNINFDDLKNNNTSNDIDMGKLFNSTEDLYMNDGLFIKPDKYSHQHEYRFVWHTETDQLPEYIDLFIPEAKKFCRKVSL